MADRSDDEKNPDVVAGNIKYNIRPKSIMKRIETEKRRNSKKQPKPKQKPPPLSKYRRKAANCRERTRMQDMNDAFCRLQKAIPVLSEESDQDKLTKITTLRLAINYINALDSILNSGESSSSSNESPASSSSADNLDDFGSDFGSLSDFGSTGSAIDSPLSEHMDIDVPMDVGIVSELLFNGHGLETLLESDGENLLFCGQATR
ncbi:Uncharacterised protein g6204 [Pycnogonum litorale]